MLNPFEAVSLYICALTKHELQSAGSYQYLHCLVGLKQYSCRNENTMQFGNEILTFYLKIEIIPPTDCKLLYVNKMITSE